MPDIRIVTQAHTEYSVTTSDTEALPANTARRYLLLINDSDTVIYLSFEGAAALNKGIRLNAAGGSYEMALEARNLSIGTVRAIHGGTGTKELLMTEGV